jgi:hypothetical protein
MTELHAGRAVLNGDDSSFEVRDVSARQGQRWDSHACDPVPPPTPYTTHDRA